MGILSMTFSLRMQGLLAVLLGLLPAVQEMAQQTLSRAREQYQGGRTGDELTPLVSWLDPDVLSRLGPSVPTGRLARLLVDARPMGP